MRKYQAAAHSKKQGSKQSANRKAQKKDAEIAHQAKVEAEKLGLRGAEKRNYIFEKLGWVPETDTKKLRELLKKFITPSHTNPPAES